MDTTSIKTPTICQRATEVDYSSCTLHYSTVFLAPSKLTSPRDRAFSSFTFAMPPSSRSLLALRSLTLSRSVVSHAIPLTSHTRTLTTTPARRGVKDAINALQSQQSSLPDTHTRNLFDLSGKVFIVTGGGRGLGLILAEALAEAGGRGMSTNSSYAVDSLSLELRLIWDSPLFGPPRRARQDLSV